MDTEQNTSERDDLRQRMAETRQSMSETVGEIKQELAEAFEWRTYLRRYPGAFLVGAAVAGVLVGRSLKPDDDDRDRDYADRGSINNDYYFAPNRAAPQPESSEHSGDSVFRKAGEVLAATVLAQIAPIVTMALRKAFGVGSRGGEDFPDRPTA